MTEDAPLRGPLGPRALDALVDLLDLERARAFARGSIFTRDGHLATSVAQEGLIRALTS